MIKEQDNKKNTNTVSNDNFIEVPGYGIGVLPEELYKPDLPQRKCPNGNSFSKTLIKNTGKMADEEKNKEREIAPGADADAATG